MYGEPKQRKWRLGYRPVDKPREKPQYVRGEFETWHQAEDKRHEVQMTYAFRDMVVFVDIVPEKTPA